MKIFKFGGASIETVERAKKVAQLIINEKPSSNPDFLLKKDELKTFFDDAFEVLDYDEFLNEENELYRMKKQSIAIRKL